MYLTMCASCEVTLVAKNEEVFQSLRIRRRATGFDRRLYTARNFEIDHSKPGIFILKGKQQLLQLPYGTYEFEASRMGRTGRSTVRRTIVLDSPKKTVRLDG